MKCIYLYGVVLLKLKNKIMKLIEIKDGYNLLRGDILSVKVGKNVISMMVSTIMTNTFEVRDAYNNTILIFDTDSLLLDIKGEYFNTPIKILGVIIDADVEPFLGFQILSENNLPVPLKPSIFKSGKKQVIGWLTKNNEIFSTAGIFKVSDFKYCKALYEN